MPLADRIDPTFLTAIQEQVCEQRDVTGETGGFGQLKIALEGFSRICASREVRSSYASPRSFLQTWSQETVSVGNKAKNLIPRVVALDNEFESRPIDVADRIHRTRVILYAFICPTITGAEFLPVSSRTSKDNFAHYARSQSRSY